MIEAVFKNKNLLVRMESTYIKTTVGPLLVSALTSLITHVPNPGATPSPNSTVLDPISYLGEYLIAHVDAEKAKAAANRRVKSDEGVLKLFVDGQKRLGKAREMLGEGLAARMSVRKSVVEKEGGGVGGPILTTSDEGVEGDE